jgi:hypothetical protein
MKLILIPYVDTVYSRISLKMFLVIYSKIHYNFRSRGILSYCLFQSNCTISFSLIFNLPYFELFPFLRSFLVFVL